MPKLPAARLNYNHLHLAFEVAKRGLAGDATAFEAVRAIKRLARLAKRLCAIGAIVKVEGASPKLDREDARLTRRARKLCKLLGCEFQQYEPLHPSCEAMIPGEGGPDFVTL